MKSLYTPEPLYKQRILHFAGFSVFGRLLPALASYFFFGFLGFLSGSSPYISDTIF